MSALPYWCLQLDSQTGALSLQVPIVDWKADHTGAVQPVTATGSSVQGNTLRLLCPDGRVLDGSQVFESLPETNAAHARAARVRARAAGYSGGTRARAEELAAAIEAQAEDRR